jgi:hypothetical protein
MNTSTTTVTLVNHQLAVVPMKASALPPRGAA